MANKHQAEACRYRLTPELTTRQVGNDRGGHETPCEELMALRGRVWTESVRSTNSVLPSSSPTAELTKGTPTLIPCFTHCLWLLPCCSARAEYSQPGPHGHKAFRLDYLALDTKSLLIPALEKYQSSQMQLYTWK